MKNYKRQKTRCNSMKNNQRRSTNKDTERIVLKALNSNIRVPNSVEDVEGYVNHTIEILNDTTTSSKKPGGNYIMEINDYVFRFSTLEEFLKFEKEAQRIKLRYNTNQTQRLMKALRKASKNIVGNSRNISQQRSSFSPRTPSTPHQPSLPSRHSSYEWWSEYLSPKYDPATYQIKDKKLCSILELGDKVVFGINAMLLDNLHTAYGIGYRVNIGTVNGEYGAGNNAFDITREDIIDLGDRAFSSLSASKYIKALN